MKRLRDTTGAVPERLETWQVDVLRSGQVILSGPPREHWQAWRDGGEGLAAWRFHKASLLRDQPADSWPPDSWWAYKAYDLHMTAEQIDQADREAYFREMASYREQQQALLDEMARRIAAQKRRERGGSGPEVQ